MYHFAADTVPTIASFSENEVTVGYRNLETFLIAELDASNLNTLRILHLTYALITDFF
jgi:hypothetical protein